MRQVGKALVVITPRQYIGCRDECFDIRDNEAKSSIKKSCAGLSSVIAYEPTGMSVDAMKLASTQNMRVAFMDEAGRFVGALEPPCKGSVFLRMNQYMAARDQDASLKIAKSCIAAKIQNYRLMINRRISNFKNKNVVHRELNSLVDFLKGIMADVERSDDIPTLMGVEGHAAARYFEIVPLLISTKAEGFDFDKRVKFPPVGRVNALLSYTYSIATNHVAGALQAVGLDPQVGFLHALRPRRLSLACDMVEEYRAWCDNFVFRLINNGQIQKKHFDERAPGSFVLNKDGKRIYHHALSEAGAGDVRHLVLEEDKMPRRTVPFAQASLLAKHLRGEIDNYPAFIDKF